MHICLLTIRLYYSSIPRFKQRVEYLGIDYGNLYDLLDAVKVADSLLLLLSTDNGVDEFGDYCLSCLLGQGLPAMTLALQVSSVTSVAGNVGLCPTWPLGYKTFFMLNSAETKVYPAHKY